MALLAGMASDQALENEGVWVAYRADTRLRVGRWGSTSYDKVWQELLTGAQGRFGDTLPDDLEEKLKREGAARALLRDWAFMDGDLDSDGMPYVVGPIRAEGDQWIRAAAQAIPRSCGADELSGNPVTVSEFEGPDGKPYRILPDGQYQRIIPYSPDLGLRLFALPEFRDLFGFVQTVAMRGSLFAAKARERTAKN